MNGFAEYLVRGKPRKSANLVKTDKRPMYPRARVSAIDNSGEEPETNETAEETIETEGAEDAVFELLIDAIKSAYKPKRAGNFQPKPASRPVQNVTKTESSVVTEADAIFQRPVICTNCLKWGHADNSCPVARITRCFGCGKEGVYKAQCDVCNGNQSKN